MDYPGAKPAVFIIKDKAIRHKAAIVGVTTVATSVIKQVLTVPRRS